MKNFISEFMTKKYLLPAESKKEAQVNTKEAILAGWEAEVIKIFGCWYCVARENKK